MTDSRPNMLTLDAYFDKILYINLDKDKERNAYMMAQFERVSGIVMNELPDRVLCRNFIKSDTRYWVNLEV